MFLCICVIYVEFHEDKTYTICDAPKAEVCFVILYVFSQDSKLAQGIIDLLKPIGHVMHQQFYIQKLYALPTLYLCVLYLSENKQRLVPLTA